MFHVKQIWNDGPDFIDFLGSEGAPPVARRHLCNGGGKSGSSGGGGTTVQNSTVSIPPEVMANYQNANAIAQNVASTPFQPYGGEFVAPVNATQQAGIANTLGQIGQTQPYFDAATGALLGGQEQAYPYYSAATGYAQQAPDTSAAYSNAALSALGSGYNASMPYLQGATNNIQGAQQQGQGITMEALQGLYNAYAGAQPLNSMALNSINGAQAGANPYNSASAMMLAQLAASMGGGGGGTGGGSTGYGGGQVQIPQINSGGYSGGIGGAPAFSQVQMPQYNPQPVERPTSNVPLAQLPTIGGAPGNLPSIGPTSAAPQFDMAGAMAALQAGQAGAGQQQQSASNLLAGALGASSPYNAQASGMVQQALGGGQGYFDAAAQQAGLGAGNVSAPQFSQSGLQQFMSPYQGQVVDATMAQLRQQQDMQRQQQIGSQIRNGAFGGDRGNIDQYILAGQQDMATGSTVANLNDANYRQALGAFQAQQGLDMTAAQANRAASQGAAAQYGQLGQMAGSQGLAGANQIAGLGSQVFGQNMGVASGQAGLGQQLFGQGNTSAQTQGQLSAQQMQNWLGQQGLTQQGQIASGQQQLAGAGLTQQGQIAQGQQGLTQQQLAQQLELGLGSQGLTAQQIQQQLQLGLGQQGLQGQQINQQGQIASAQLGQQGQIASAQMGLQGQIANINAALQQQGMANQMTQAQWANQLGISSQLAGLGQQTFGQGMTAAQQQAALAGQVYGQGANTATAAGALGQQMYGQGMTAAQQQAALASQLSAMGSTGANLMAGLGQQNTAAQQNSAQMMAGLGQGLYGMGNTTAGSLANLGTGQQTNALNLSQALMGAGGVQQQTNQALDQAQYNQFLQQQGYPFQAAQFLANIAMGTGALSGSTTNATTTQPGSMFSEPSMKDNKEVVGKTFDGQPIYKFNYKGDDTTRLGLMADKVEQAHPDAITHVGDKRAVNYDMATADAADRGHFAFGGAPSGGAGKMSGGGSGKMAGGDASAIQRQNYPAPWGGGEGGSSLPSMPDFMSQFRGPMGSGTQTPDSSNMLVPRGRMSAWQSAAPQSGLGMPEQPGWRGMMQNAMVGGQWPGGGGNSDPGIAQQQSPWARQDAAAPAEPSAGLDAWHPQLRQQGDVPRQIFPQMQQSAMSAPRSGYADGGAPSLEGLQQLQAMFQSPLGNRQPGPMQAPPTGGMGKGAPQGNPMPGLGGQGGNPMPWAQKLMGGHPSSALSPDKIQAMISGGQLPSNQMGYLTNLPSPFAKPPGPVAGLGGGGGPGVGLGVPGLGMNFDANSGSANGGTGDNSGSATGEAGSVGAGVGTAAGNAGATAASGEGSVGADGLARGGPVSGLSAGLGFAPGGMAGDYGNYGDDVLERLLGQQGGYGGPKIYGPKIGGSNGPYGVSLGQSSAPRQLMQAQLLQPRPQSNEAANAMNTINSAVKTGENLYGAGKLGKEAYGKIAEWLKPYSSIDDLMKSDDVLKTAGDVAEPVAGLGSTAADGFDALSGFGDYFARGGRTGYAGGGLPYSGIDDEYVPDDLTNPEPVKKLEPAPLPAIPKQQSDSGGGGGMGGILGGLGALGSIAKLGMLFLKDGGVARRHYDEGDDVPLEVPEDQNDPVAKALRAINIPDLPPKDAAPPPTPRAPRETFPEFGPTKSPVVQAALDTATRKPAPPTDLHPSGDDDSVVHKLFGAESAHQHFDPRTGAPTTSPKGAVGLAQVMPETGPEAAKLAGLPWNPELFNQRRTGDPAKDKAAEDYSRALGQAYYQEQRRTFGDPRTAVAAYNAGPGAVRNAMAKAQASGGNYLNFLPSETQNHVAKVFGGARPDALNAPAPSGNAPVPYMGGQPTAPPSYDPGRPSATSSKSDDDGMPMWQRLLLSGLTGLGGAAAMGMDPRAKPLGVALAGLGAGASQYANLYGKDRELGMKQQQIDVAKTGMAVRTQQFVASNLVPFYDPQSGKLMFQNKLTGDKITPAERSSLLSSLTGKSGPASGAVLSPNAPTAPTAPQAPGTEKKTAEPKDGFDDSIIANPLHRPSYLNAQIAQLTNNIKDAQGNNLPVADFEKQRKELSDQLHGVTKGDTVPVDKSGVPVTYYIDQARGRGTDTAFAGKMSEARASHYGDATKYLGESYAQNEALISSLANIYQKIETNRGSQSVADMIGLARSVPWISEAIGPQMKDLLSAQQSGNDAAAKVAIAQAFKEIAANGATRAPGVALREALLTVANPEMAPGAKYNVLANSRAMNERERQRYEDWFEAGKPDPGEFSVKWSKDKDHSLEAFKQRAVDSMEYFKGMTPKEKALLMNQRSDDTAPKTNSQTTAAPVVPADRSQWKPGIYTGAPGSKLAGKRVRYTADGKWELAE